MCNNFQSPCCPATSNTISVQLQCYTKKLLAHPDCMDVPHLNPQHKQKRSSVLQGLSFFEFHPHTAEYPTISDLTLSSSLEPCVHALAIRLLKVEVGRSTRCSRGVSLPKTEQMARMTCLPRKAIVRNYHQSPHCLKVP